MEAVRTSETSVSSETTPHNIPEGSHLHTRHREKLKSHIIFRTCVKQSRYMPWRRLEERRYSSYSFSTSALDGMSGQRHAPAALLPPGKGPPGTHYTGGWVGPRAGLDTEARGKIRCPRRGSNLDRPVVQPLVRHFTAWANPAALELVYAHLRENKQTN
jgi:hypothetical protein